MAKVVEGYNRDGTRVVIVLEQVAHVEIHPETVAIYMKSGAIHVFPNYSNSRLAGSIRQLLEDQDG